MVKLSPVADATNLEIDALLDAAFGADRRRKTAYVLRGQSAALPECSFIVRDDTGALIGSIQLWPIRLVGDDGSEHALTLLGPVAVTPALQRSGIGKMLMQHALDAAAAAGIDALLLVGDPEYYGRFGFVAEPTAGWTMPGPVERHRLLARLTPAAARRLPQRGRLLATA